MKQRPLFLMALMLPLIPHGLPAGTVQVDIRPLLNARIVTTWTGDRLETWRDSLDNAGSGMATQAAAARMGGPQAKALPDDGRFPATARHPAVQLNFSNADGTGNQVHRSIGADAFEFAVPPGHYTQLALYCMSGMGPSQLTVTLCYEDGTTATRAIEAPDWWNSMPPDDPVRYDLAEDMGKWGADDKMMEPDHHYITGLELQPDPARALERVKVTKAEPGVLTLWGVTGTTR